MVIDSESIETWLTARLFERTEIVASGALGDGPIVYWMHRALRLEENPALEVAVALSKATKRPLALVAELASDRDPYASARHWSFELEGLVALRAQVQQLGGVLTLIVESDQAPGSKYREILDSAGALVMEDLPVASERRYREVLLEALEVPLVTVDASCVIPMQWTKKTIRRAFAFRDRYKDSIASAIRSAEPSSLDFKDVQWAPVAQEYALNDESELADIIANAPIDHDVGPVTLSRGGREAGLKRWRDFVKNQGLHRYAKRRNDALLETGVSRMSAYLHYGFVSPFELARWGQSSEKYVDELIVWRELAWHYCKTVPTHDVVDALPSWALSSLKQYGTDKDPAPSWNALWNGETPDPFWNACQRSLRKLGELHNNVRMTWGKALVGWASSPEVALRWLIELNHRLALDGNDPASYGGLLWCLGEFDRPFKPAKPLWGEVRDRATEIHAERCPPERLEHQTASRNGYEGLRVGVVGAGAAGLSAALTLRAHGLDVRVWDKGYNPGGRIARRPTSDGGGIEHGTSGFEVQRSDLQSRRFRQACRGWEADGLLRFGAAGSETFDGRGNLQGWLREAGRLISISQKTAVTRVVAEGQGFKVYGEEEPLGVFDAVLCTVPGPQLNALLDKTLGDVLRPLDEIVYSPSVVVAAAWPRGLEPDKAEMASWLGGAKVVEQRASAGFSTWTIEASLDWSTRELERSKEELAVIFREVVAAAGYTEPSLLWAHRWRYARVERPLGQPFWRWSKRPLFWAGDGAFGGGVEGAWCSGQRAASAILSSLRAGSCSEG